ncbi:MAG: hypothetical protein AABW56_02515 [Nanoarchaeota archaeon]
MGDIRYFEEKGKLYKIDNDGEKYRVSFSEELQLKNLKAAKENKKWLIMNFYGKMALAFIMLMLFVVLVYVLYRLDQINFFTGVLYR